MDLTLEEEFKIAKFSDYVRGLSREQAQDLLIDLYRKLLIMDGCYKKAIGERWGFR